MVATNILLIAVHKEITDANKTQQEHTANLTKGYHKTKTLRQINLQIVRRVNKLPSNSKASKKLVAKGFGLGNGAEPSVANLLSVQLDAVLWEFEPLLYHGS